MFTWKKGRQGTGYKVFTIVKGWKWLPVDMHILKYPTGSFAKPHKDVCIQGRHFRLNLVVYHKGKGGIFECEECFIKTKYLVLFRPDLHIHSVSQVEKGVRYVVSLGIVIKDKGVLEDNMLTV